MTDARSRRLTSEYLLLLLAVIACSTAVLLIKVSTAHPLVLVGARTLIASLVLLPFVRSDLRSMTREIVWSFPGALLLAVHFISWTIGARSTNAANATLIINLNPIAMPFFMALINHERIHRHELVGTLIAIAGVVGLIGRDYQVGAATLTGDAICVFSMVVFCGYLALSRRFATPGSSLLAYLVPLYGMTGVICLASAALVHAPWPALTPRDLLPLVGLALVPTVIGHSILNHSIRVLRGQVVTTVNLLQVICAGVMAYYLLHEQAPPLRLYVAGGVITIGMLVVVDMIRWRQ